MQVHQDKTDVPTSKLEKTIIPCQNNHLENSEIMTNFSLQFSHENIVIFLAESDIF